MNNIHNHHISPKKQEDIYNLNQSRGKIWMF